MPITDAFPGPSGITDATELRKNLAGLIVRDANGNARPGVFFRSATPFVSGRADMKYDVGLFHGASVRGGGPLFQANDGVQTISTTTAPLSNQRYDIVYFKHNESASPYSDPDNAPQLAVYQGATGAPADLTATLAALAIAKPGAVPVYSALIPSTATATNSVGVLINQICQFTATTGGVVPFRLLTDLKNWTTAVDSQLAYAMDTRQTYQYLAAATPPGWYHVAGAPLAGTITYGGIYTGAGTPAGVYTQNGRVYLEGAVTTNVQATYAADTAYTLGNVGTALAPTKRVVAFGPWGTTGTSQVSVETNGDIVFRAATAPGTVNAGVLVIWLSALNWPLKGL